MSPAFEAERQTFRYLAPTYDHASSMGSHLKDEERRKRLTTSDRGYTVEAYSRKARSALYMTPSDGKPMYTVEAFTAAAERYPSAAKIWLDRLAGVSEVEIDKLFLRLPPERISEPASQFARRLLRSNGRELLGLRGIL